MKNKIKSNDQSDSILKINDSYFGRLKICLLLQSKYKEAFRNLRDALGGNQALSGFPSISSSLPNSELNISSKDLQTSTTLSSKKTMLHNLNRRHESMKTSGNI